MYFIFVHPNVLPTWMYILNERTTFVCSVVFDCLPDLKPGVGSAFLPTSDSSQALLPKRCVCYEIKRKNS
ncbi:hypothetical protein ANCCAN_23620 [Ancylostoma caninum]|uniref:Uncharacterized protein n=1 Tax=Ancylostoma caninum TaxID=29170 RepID=A0A368FEJ8_ANCCA|nr:hypothetical protein ANCCAN_23620 [Ancylostoma caninum]